MDISRSRHSESALQCRRQVGDDIAEHVVGHNHLKIFGLANHKQTKRIYIKVAGLNPRVPGGGLLEAPLPQVAGVGQHIRFVAHADLRFPVPARIIESVFNDAVNALAGVDLHLVRHFIGSSLLEDTAGVHVRALGVLTDDGKVTSSTRTPLSGHNLSSNKRTGRTFAYRSRPNRSASRISAA